MTPEEIRSRLEGAEIHIVPYAHCDWAWTHTRAWHERRYVLIFEEVLQILRAYPEFRWYLDSWVTELRPLLDRRPDLVPELHARIREGEIAVCGAFANVRPNMVGEETFLRNLAHGRRRFRELFPDVDLTVHADIVDVSVGHPQMPQVLRLAGYRYFRCWRPHEALSAKGIPYEFIWEGLDGSRILCSRGRIDSHRLRRGMLNEHEIKQLQMICDELRDAPLFIDDTPGMTVLELRAKARRLWLQHKIKAVFIDYLQLMYTPGAESRQQEIAIISRGLKALGRELNIPIISLAQLNRATEGRDGHRPRMSDLRESGAIEQDADVVALLHRPSYYDPNEEPNVAEVIIAKQRNGPTGTVKLHFDGRSTRFDNLSMAPEPYGGAPAAGGGVPPGYNTDGPGLAPSGGDAEFTPF